MVKAKDRESERVRKINAQAKKLANEKNKKKEKDKTKQARLFV